MAEEYYSTSPSNFFVNSFGTNNHINLNFISVTNHFSENPFHLHQQRHPISSSRYSILTFSAAALVNFLELKYQGKNESPFETHPKIMFLAVASLLLYCLAYDARSRFSSSNFNVRICGIAMVFLGPLSLAALSSVLLPQLLCPVLFSLSILFSFFQLPFSMVIILNFWKWIQESIWVETVQTPQQQQGRSRRLMELVENVYLEEDEIYNNLPV